VLRQLVQFAEQFEIRFIRLPAEELHLTLGIDRSNLITKLLWTGIFGGLRRYGEQLLQTRGIRFSQRVYGLLQTGRMTEDYWLKLLPKIRADLVEIYSHPDCSSSEQKIDSGNSGAAELAALLSDRVGEQIVHNGFQLTNYRDYLAQLSTHPHIPRSIL